MPNTQSINMIWVIITGLSWSAVSGSSEFYRIKDKAFGNESDNKKWHTLEFFDAGLALGTGIAIGYDTFESEDLLVGVSDIILVSAIRWIVRDGVYNLSNGNDWFYRSPNTTSGIEQLGTPLNKLIFLISAMIFRLLL